MSDGEHMPHGDHTKQRLNELKDKIKDSAEKRIYIFGKPKDEFLRMRDDEQVDFIAKALSPGSPKETLETALNANWNEMVRSFERLLEMPRTPLTREDVNNAFHIDDTVRRLTFEGNQPAAADADGGGGAAADQLRTPWPWT